jgi:branched-chain amino acid transport system permease protein
MRKSHALVLALLLAGAFALPYLAQLWGYPALIALTTRILIYGMAAASLNLALGYGGMVSFGHAAYFGLGGYVVGILYQNFTQSTALWGLIPGTNELLITLPAAMLVGGMAAGLIGALSLRTSGVQFIMITLAFAQMLFFFFVALKAYGGDDGLIVRRRNILFGLNTRDDQIFYFIVLVINVLFYAMLWRLVASPFGHILGGIRQNPRRMEAMAYSPFRYQWMALVISGMGTALAGALLANYARFVSPDMLHWTKSGELMVMVIIGGTGTLFGPLLGAIALVSLETVLAGFTENWQLALGFILLAIVLYTRGGLVGLWLHFKGRVSKVASHE